MQAESFKSQLTSLRTELGTAQAALSRERAINAAIEAGAMKGSDYLTSTLFKARQETASVSAEYAACCAEIQSLEEELTKSKSIARRALQLKEEETMAALEASAVATSAAMRRAELQQENDELVEELIESKLLCAELSTQFHEERRRYFALRKRLQRYAQRVAELEVQALAKEEDIEGKNKMAEADALENAM